MNYVSHRYVETTWDAELGTAGACSAPPAEHTADSGWATELLRASEAPTGLARARAALQLRAAPPPATPAAAPASSSLRGRLASMLREQSRADHEAQDESSDGDGIICGSDEYGDSDTE